MEEAGRRRSTRLICICFMNRFSQSLLCTSYANIRRETNNTYMSDSCYSGTHLVFIMRFTAEKNQA